MEKSVHDMLSKKDEEFQQLNQQFIAYEQQSKLIIDELQAENSKLKQVNKELQNQLQSLKVKRKQQVNLLEREVDKYKRESSKFQQQNQQMQRQLVDLQNNNEGLQNQLRAVNALLQQYQSKVQKTMEQLACLRFELQECKETNQQQIARLKSQIQQTEEQLNVIKMKHQKHQDQSGLRMSQFSWSSLSKDKKWKDCLNLTTFNNQNSFVNMKKKPFESSNTKQNGFERTFQLMNSLLIDLDKKCLKIKYNSKKDIL